MLNWSSKKCTKLHMCMLLHQVSPWASQVVLVVKNLLDNAGDIRDVDSIPELGRSSGGEHNPLQYSCLENPWTEEPGGLSSIGLQRAGHD